MPSPTNDPGGKPTWPHETHRPETLDAFGTPLFFGLPNQYTRNDQQWVGLVDDRPLCVLPMRRSTDLVFRGHGFTELGQTRGLAPTYEFDGANGENPARFQLLL